MEEPKLIYCTERITSNTEWLDIECRFSDGQKYAAVQVCAENQQLATLIVKLLNEYISNPDH